MLPMHCRMYVHEFQLMITMDKSNGMSLASAGMISSLRFINGLECLDWRKFYRAGASLCHMEPFHNAHVAFCTDFKCVSTTLIECLLCKPFPGAFILVHFRDAPGQIDRIACMK